MSGETEAQESGWTVDTLRYAIHQQFSDLNRLLDERHGAQTIAMNAALAAAEKAVTKAEVATEKRFESVNEFRQTLSDQTAGFMPRAEAESAIQRSIERVDELRDRLNRIEGRGVGLTAAWGYLLGVVGVLVAVYTATH